MSPLAVLTAIVLGSSVAIGFGLGTVWFLAFWLRGESRQLDSEILRLPFYCMMFLILATISGSALYSIFKQKPWRWWAQIAMWGAVVLMFNISWRAT